MRQKKIHLGGQPAIPEPAFDEKAVKRGYQLSQTTAHLFQSISGGARLGVDPKILAAAALASVFLLATLLFSSADSPDEVRGRIPELREQTFAYLTPRLGPNQQPLIVQRWQMIERRLQEIAHNRRLQDWKQLRLKIDELLAQEPDRLNPVHRFCLELRQQTPPE